MPMFFSPCCRCVSQRLVVIFLVVVVLFAVVLLNVGYAFFWLVNIVLQDGHGFLLVDVVNGLLVLNWCCCWIILLDADGNHLDECDELDLCPWPYCTWPLSMCSVDALVVLDPTMYLLYLTSLDVLWRCTCCTWPLSMYFCVWPLSMHLLYLTSLYVLLWVELLIVHSGDHCPKVGVDHLTVLTSVNEFDHSVVLEGLDVSCFFFSLMLSSVAPCWHCHAETVPMSFCWRPLCWWFLCHSSIQCWFVDFCWTRPWWCWQCRWEVCLRDARLSRRCQLLLNVVGAVGGGTRLPQKCSI